MGKVIFWLVVFFAVLLVLRLINVSNDRRRRRKDERASRRSPPAGSMLRCVDCGVYLPSADAKFGPRGPLCGDPICLRRANNQAKH
jgi:hypothetical protein